MKKKKEIKHRSVPLYNIHSAFTNGEDKGEALAEFETCENNSTDLGCQIFWGLNWEVNYIKVRIALSVQIAV